MGLFGKPEGNKHNSQCSRSFQRTLMFEVKTKLYLFYSFFVFKLQMDQAPQPSCSALLWDVGWCCTYCQGTQGSQGLLSTWRFLHYYHKTKEGQEAYLGLLPPFWRCFLWSSWLPPACLLFPVISHIHMLGDKTAAAALSRLPQDYYFPLLSLLLSPQHDLFSVKQAML